MEKQPQRWDEEVFRRRDHRRGSVPLFVVVRIILNFVTSGCDQYDEGAAGSTKLPDDSNDRQCNAVSWPLQQEGLQFLDIEIFLDKSQKGGQLHRLLVTNRTNTEA